MIKLNAYENRDVCLADLKQCATPSFYEDCCKLEDEDVLKTIYFMLRRDLLSNPTIGQQLDKWDNKYSYDIHLYRKSLHYRVIYTLDDYLGIDEFLQIERIKD